MRLTPHNLGGVLRRSLVASFDDNCFAWAKAAAYSAILSFFPLLTSAATILVQTRADIVSRTVEKGLSMVVPPGSEGLVVQQFQITGARPSGLLVIAGLISIWAASGVIKSLIEGFQAAYRVPRNRGFWRGSAVAMLLVVLAAIPLLGASLVIVFGGQVERAVLITMRGDPLLHPLTGTWAWVSRVGRYGISFGATVVVTASLYYFGPNRRQRWRYVWPGAVLATVLWLLATSVFAWYVRNIAHYNVMYGSVGAVIALLVWMYLLAAIALIGCEFNAEYERSVQ